MTTGGIARRGLLAALVAAGQASAQEVPARPIRLIVPFAPGGGTDLIARVLATRLGELLGQTVVVENRAGASGAIGTAAVARSRADGTTLLFTSSPAIVVLPALQPPPPYDPERDLTPIATLARQAILFVVPAASPLRTLDDLIAAARTRPLSYGTPGAGTDPHLAGLALAEAGGVTLTHVPYRGGGPALTGLLSGDVDFLPALTGVARPVLAEGRVRAIATTNAVRHADLPDVPTTAELGFPRVDLVPWWGLFAPVGLEPPVARRLDEVARIVADSAEWQRRLDALAIEAAFLDGAATAAGIRRQIADWRTRLAGRSFD